MMDMNARRIRWIFLLTLGFAILLSPTGLRAATPDASIQKTFHQLLDAIQNNDRTAFVSHATAAVKKAMTPQVMEAVHKQYGDRLQKGYDATYLCELNQKGLHVHLWKITFKDGGDDIAIRMAMKDDLVAGFFFE